MYAGDQCKARVGPRPALFHHFCYEKYCKEILKKVLHDEENGNLCMDCKDPQTVDVAPPSGNVQPMARAAQPPKGKRGARKANN